MLTGWRGGAVGTRVAFIKSDTQGDELAALRGWIDDGRREPIHALNWHEYAFIPEGDAPGQAFYDLLAGWE